MTRPEVPDSGNSLLPLDIHLPGRDGGPLAGLTYVTKDNIDVAGHPTGNGNPEFNSWRGTPARNARVVDQLQAAGATLVGKTQLHELAYGLTGVNPHYGTPVNPLVPDGIPAGSSSGTAVAVARGVADFGLGSDTGGSVRVPAGYCGLYGWRPTYGLLSAEGTVPLGKSFDTVGVLARDLDVLGQVMESLLSALDSKAITRIQLPQEVTPWLHDDVAFAWEREADLLMRHGFTVERFDGDLFELARLVQAPLQAAEAYEYHRAWIESARPRLGADVARLLDAASKVSPEQVLTASEQRQYVREQLTMLLPPGRAMLVPAAPVTPPLLSEIDGEAGAEFRINGLRLTNLASLTGLPAITYPAATADGLPVGMQLIGSWNSDLELLAVLERL